MKRPTVGENELRDFLTEQHRALMRTVAGWLPRQARPVDVDDVVQETYLKALRSASTLRTAQVASLRAWLFRIARNLIIDDSRRSGRHSLGAASDPDGLAAPDEPTDRVHEGGPFDGGRGGALYDLLHLRRDERMALVLRDFQIVSWETSTVVLRRPSEKAARNLLLRGRARLPRAEPLPGQSFA